MVAVKMKELDGKALLKRDEIAVLRGRIFVLKPEDSEIAKNLKINEKGIFGVKR